MHKLLLLAAAATLLPNAYALPSFARQTGQRCGACHIGGNWPQLTPWGRFFKLAGYTPGKALVSKEGFEYVPLGLLAQVGVNWAPHPNDSQGNVLITQSGAPEAYGFTAELGTKITNFAGVFAEYGVSNTFPGWKGASGPIDIRATHFFHPGNNELLVGVDSNNDPTLQDVWNTVPSWGFPFYGAPQAPGAPGSPMIASLAQETGSIGAYALWNREFYVELSMYRVGNGFFRFMNAGTSYETGAQYLKGFNPYWRAYWTKDHGPNVFMVGTFGMRSNIYPDSGTPSGGTDLFSDTGFDAQYQHLGDTRKLTLRSSYIYEKQSWNASYPLAAVDNPHDNLKTLNLNGAYTVGDGWTFSGGYFFSNGSGESAFYNVTDTNGNQLSTKPNTTGYVFEVDRTLTQNVLASLQYTGFTKFQGLTSNIDGIGRKPSDNNTLWFSLFFAF
jgi:hypothetical protein